MNSKTTNCRECKDCQRMRTIGTGEVSHRCYGDSNGVELKRDIPNSTEPPVISPDWCPNRQSDKSLRVKYE